MNRRAFLKGLGATVGLAATAQLGVDEMLAMTESGLYVPPTVEQNAEFTRTLWALDKTATYDPTKWRIIDRRDPYSPAWAHNVWGEGWHLMERVTALYEPTAQGFELSRTKEGFVYEDRTPVAKTMGFDPNNPEAEGIMILDYNKHLSLIAAELIPVWAKEQGFINEPKIVPQRTRRWSSSPRAA